MKNAFKYHITISLVENCADCHECALRKCFFKHRKPSPKSLFHTLHKAWLLRQQ